jgi:hypothetical protein
VFVLGVPGSTILDAQKEKLSVTYGGSTFEFTNKLRMETLYAKNTRLLNNDNEPNNRFVIPGKHTWDGKFFYRYRDSLCDYDAMRVLLGVRNKGVWGDPESIAKTQNRSVKDLEVVFGTHQHPISVHIPIIRELWMQISLNHFFGLSFAHRHTLTMGLFPFELGRGIALGSAYGTVPDLIGYDPEDSIQQFAPGFLLSGGLFGDNAVTYDVYASIGDNKSGNFNNVNTKIRGGEFGKRFDQARGFGVINYILATRFVWHVFDDLYKKMHVEPYALFNDEREQRVEFIADATSQLGTFGLASEMQAGNFEAGFDMAFNIGKQVVKGFDRNTIRHQNRTGRVTIVNSQINATVDDPATNNLEDTSAVYDPSFDYQAAINDQVTGIDQCDDMARFNGEIIPDSQPPLRNSNTRFRNRYENDFDGSMFVFDCAYYVDSIQGKIAAATGFATGDENPNRDLNGLGESERDGNFEGFIGLREIYSGKRVRSRFLLNNSVARVPRVLSFPTGRRGTNFQDRFASQVSGFTNIIYYGNALWFERELCGNKWLFNPNVLSFWQQNQTEIFNPETNMRGMEPANRHLGVEINAIIEGELIDDLTFFAVVGVFVPGEHFDDIQGRPLNKDQEQFLDRRDRTGVTTDPVPLLGNDNAWFINTGFEYRF